MRDLNTLNKWRQTGADVVELYGDAGDGTCGRFRFRHKGQDMLAIASTAGGWDHVSVSFANRCPTWDEMVWIKDKFFEDGETCMELHVPKGDHISYHPYALHLWRPQNQEIPRPPGWMVGPKT